MDLFPLPAPLHLRPLRMQSISSHSAQIELEHFLDDETANRIMSGNGAMKDGLKRLLESLKDEEKKGLKVRDASRAGEVAGSSKKRKDIQEDNEKREKKKQKKDRKK